MGNMINVASKYSYQDPCDLLLILPFPDKYVLPVLLRCQFMGTDIIGEASLGDSFRTSEIGKVRYFIIVLILGLTLI